MVYNKNMLKIKRIYEPAEKSDGIRILVDRLWPRGVSKEKAHLDAWFKDIAPSDTLRKDFHHNPTMWNEFQKKYTEELSTKSELIKQIKMKTRTTTVTLLFGAKDTEHNQAVVLKKYIDDNM